LWTILVLLITALLSTTYEQFKLAAQSSPFVPFLGHKLFMGILGLTLATRTRLGAVLIVGTAANAIALWLLLGIRAHAHNMAGGEPWVTLFYMLLGLFCLRMHEQRKLASLQLLRAEAEAAAIQRHARMFLAVRDRLNTPLQIVLLASHSPPLVSCEAGPVQDALDRLVDLSRELAKLEVATTSTSASLDADRELRTLA
jgi:hypothetical protein